MLIPVALATLLSVLVSSIAGRLAGLGITAACTAFLAYFVMPPVLSFRISNARDIVALTLYGVAGLVLARSAPKKLRTAKPLRDVSHETGKRQRIESALSAVVDDIIAAHVADQMNTTVVTVADDAIVPLPKEVLSPILADVLMAALKVPNLQRISIAEGRRPGVVRLTVTAHYIWPFPLLKTVTIGKAAVACDHVIEFDRWPSTAHATWFDNGYGVVYQISIQKPATPS